MAKQRPFSTHPYTIKSVGKVYLRLPTKMKGPANRAGHRWKRITAAVAEANKSRKLKHTANCPVIVFKAETNHPVAVQRCDNSKFFKTASFRKEQREAAKKQCTRKRGKRILFAKCR